MWKSNIFKKSESVLLSSGVSIMLFEGINYWDLANDFVIKYLKNILQQSLLVIFKKDFRSAEQ